VSNSTFDKSKLAYLLSGLAFDESVLANMESVVAI